jgi:PHP family Zn ribbon phosphoesterase
MSLGLFIFVYVLRCCTKCSRRFALQPSVTLLSRYKGIFHTTFQRGLFSRVHKIAKNDYYLRPICLSVRLSVVLPETTRLPMDGLS